MHLGDGLRSKVRDRLEFAEVGGKHCVDVPGCSNGNQPKHGATFETTGNVLLRVQAAGVGPRKFFAAPRRITRQRC
jgi:hypothetical protein